jgi:pre-mRNA-splicing helicase BRR2
MIVQAKWHDASTLTTLPNIDDDKLATFARHRIECLPELVHFLKGAGDNSRRRVHELERQLSRKGMTKGECSRAFNAALALPLINVNWSMETDVFGPDSEGRVNVVLSRVNMQSMKVMSPVRKYNGKSEGHWLVLGCEEQGELLALKRVTVRKKTETTLNFYTEDLDIESGDVTLSLYLISDSYLGLDQ